MLAIAALVAAVAVVGGRAERAATKTASCAPPRATAAHTSKVERALRTRHDVWGNALLNAPDGPSYEAARRLLPPLLYARAPGKRALTESGVYYVPFGQPLGARGAGSVALHVADGSQVIAERVGGRRLTVLVGAKGRERYGSCVARLGQARLAGGYLPIMSTTYTDGSRVRYRQESFAAQTSETGSLVSFIRLDVDASACVDEGRPAAAEAVCQATAAGARLQPRRLRQALRADLPDQARDEADDLPRLDQLPRPPHPHRRRGPLRPRAPRRLGVLERPAAGRHADHRPRAAGLERLPQPRDPEPAPDLALQHRQPVRAVLVPGGRRRRRGDGRARLPRRRALDHAHVADAEGHAVSELEGGQAADRVGAPLPAHARPRLHRRRHADAAALRRRARPPDRGRRHRPARTRALLLRHRRAGARPALAGDGLAGARGDGPRLGGDWGTRSSRAAARRSPSCSRQACGGRSPPRSGGSATARCSCRRGCSTASPPTGR